MIVSEFFHEEKKSKEKSFPYGIQLCVYVTSRFLGKSFMSKSILMLH